MQALVAGFLRLYLGYLSDRLLPKEPLRHQRLKSSLIDNYDSIISLGGSGLWLSIFIAGIGRYRTVLFFATYYLILAGFELKKKNPWILHVIFLPAAIITLRFDLSAGQLFPLFIYHNFILTMSIVSIVRMLLIQGYLFRALQILSAKTIFRTCPRCRFDNMRLVIQCTNCLYDKSQEASILDAINTGSSTMASADIKSETEIYMAAGAYQPPTDKLIRLIGLNDGEIILINIKCFFRIRYYKNSHRDAVSNLVLTTKRIIFVHSLIDSDGWRLKETIDYHKLTEASTEMTKHFTNKVPALLLNTASDRYEITFSSATPYAPKLISILDCIRKRRSGIPITIKALEPFMTMTINEQYSYMLKELDRDPFEAVPKDKPR
ncbi:MAG: hypothetical protein HZA15_08145 [Nitrospirae bacterium]|nr:hypothetical protein [Nitrospirota bacterium]